MDFVSGHRQINKNKSTLMLEVAYKQLHSDSEVILMLEVQTVAL